MAKIKSIEEKAKAYDNVVGKLKRFMAQGVDPLITRADVQDFFPEVKESEDERIRKAIEYAIGQSTHPDGTLINGVSSEEALAWLEKQGEQKSTLRIDNSKAKVVFPFKAKVKSTGIVVTIHGGQLSANGNEWIKYQSDKEDRYKVYKPEDLEPVCNVEHNLAWSEEDLYKIENALFGTYAVDVATKLLNKIKSIKDRVQPKQEWSEGDSPYYDDICEILINLLHSETADVNKDAVQKDLDWFISLRPQNTWKPSEEQMEVLTWCLPLFVEPRSKAVLQSLINDLKKLMEE